jgi:hypothetical protein
MPPKFNADRCDKIPKQKQRVTSWSEYDEGLHGARTPMQVFFVGVLLCTNWQSACKLLQ